jgi:hypothetical protein
MRFKNREDTESGLRRTKPDEKGPERWPTVQFSESAVRARDDVVVAFGALTQSRHPPPHVTMPDYNEPMGQKSVPSSCRPSSFIPPAWTVRRGDTCREVFFAPGTARRRRHGATHSCPPLWMESWMVPAVVALLPLVHREDVTTAKEEQWSRRRDRLRDSAARLSTGFVCKSTIFFVLSALNKYSSQSVFRKNNVKFSRFLGIFSYTPSVLK